MNRFTLPLLVPFAVGALWGCDGRASDDYHGTSLLSVTGSVLLQNPDAPDDLVPALAFRTGNPGESAIVDVAVAGEFPARFTFDVFEPPPSAAIFEPHYAGDGVTGPGSGEPEIALAYIAAVRPDHASVARSADHNVGSGFLRYWPNVATSLDDGKVALGPNGTVHEAHAFDFFANVSVGWAFDL